MNFFKSVFDDSDENPEDPQTEATQEEEEQEDDPNPDESRPNQAQPTSQVWSFGGLMKTLQVKSEWIDTYKRDLEEFGSGLKRETAVLKDVATKSLEIGQTSLESVGNAVDSLSSSVADIITHGKDVLLAPDSEYFSDDMNNDYSNSNVGRKESLSLGGRYSRFEAQLRGIQSDERTYVEEVEDEKDYDEWRRGFDLIEKSEEIDGLVRENESVEGIYRKVVPGLVSHDLFWCRYYYRVFRLERAENVRAKLVKRAISTEDEEELSWDVDDEEEEEEEVVVGKVGGQEGKDEVSEKVEDEGKSDEGKSNVVELAKEEGVSEEVQSDTNGKEVVNEEGQLEGNAEVNDNDEGRKAEEKVVSEVKTEPSESSKDSDITVVSPQGSNEEDDMGWDEIEDIGSGDEKKDANSESPDRAELRKRLSAAADDEDLSWDIEDDDEPLKA